MEKSPASSYAVIEVSSEAIRPRYLLTSIQPGLFFRSRLPLLEAMASMGWEVHVALPESNQWRADLEARGYTVHELRLHRGSTHPVREMETLGDFRKIARSVQPDLSHHFSSKAVIYGSLAGTGIQISTLTGIGFSLVGAGTARERLPTRILAPWLYRTALRKNHRVIFQNEDDRTEFLRRKLVRSGATRLLPGSGVDMREFHPTKRRPSGGPIHAVMLSRMIRPKGVVEFAEAARIIRNASPGQFRFTLCGPLDKQNPSAIPESQILAWVSEGILQWRREVPSAIDAYADADIAVLPSYHEGLPRALVEASAMGLPIVSTETRGCRDVVVAGVTGLLVPVRNAAALATAIQTLGEDRSMQDQLGRAGRLHVQERYGVDRIVRETLDIYAQELAALGKPLRMSKPTVLETVAI